MSDDGYVEWEESQDMAEMYELFCEQEPDLFGEWLHERYASYCEGEGDALYDRLRDEKAEESMKESSKEE